MAFQEGLKIGSAKKYCTQKIFLWPCARQMCDIGFMVHKNVLYRYGTACTIHMLRGYRQLDVNKGSKINITRNPGFHSIIPALLKSEKYCSGHIQIVSSSERQKSCASHAQIYRGNEVGVKSISWLPEDYICSIQVDLMLKMKYKHHKTVVVVVSTIFQLFVYFQWN